MRKSSFLVVGAALLLAACSQKPVVKEFALSGKLTGNDYDGKEVYLQTIDDSTGEYVSIDTAKIENGTFAFSGVIEAPVVNFIAMDGLRRPAVVVLSADSVEISFDSANVATVRGSELNDKYQSFVEKRNEINKAMMAIGKEDKEARAAKTMTPEFEAQLEQRYDSVYNLLKQGTFDFTKENISNVVGQYFLMDRGISFDADQLGELLPALDPKLKGHKKIQRLEQRLTALQSTVVGQPFVDLKGATPTGEIISLSDYAGEGKIVLIDFWASWCPPCRKDMPTVVKTYAKYKDKGFEIVGVSLDDDKAAWEKGITDLNVTWPQMSDLKGWSTDLGAAYAVNSIPHTVLLDKEGKIIAKNLRPDEIDAKLAELLK